VTWQIFNDTHRAASLQPLSCLLKNVFIPRDGGRESSRKGFFQGDCMCKNVAICHWFTWTSAGCGVFLLAGPAASRPI